MGEVRDRHDSGNNRNGNTGLGALINEAEIGVRVVEILGNGAVGPGINLALEVDQILFGAGCLRVIFGIGGHFDMKLIVEFGPDKTDQFIGVTKFARIARPVAARRSAPAR